MKQPTIQIVGNGDITAAELARRTADEIEKRGFTINYFEVTRGMYVDFNKYKVGTVCSLGAIGHVLKGEAMYGDNVRRSPAVMAICKALGEPYDLATWNNSHRIEQGDKVISDLRRAADIIDATYGDSTTAPQV